MSVPVYTYYDPIEPGKSRHTPESQRDLIEVWRESWEKRGWSPVVLSRRTADEHPQAEYFRKQFLKLPTQYGYDHQMTSFMRWVAMVVVGGGLMVDYDVINYSFLPQPFMDDRLVIYADTPPDTIFMGAVSGRPGFFEQAADTFAMWQVTDDDFIEDSSEYRGYHCSDLSILKQIFLSRGWMFRSPGCALYGYKGWQQSPMVHYHTGIRLQNGDSAEWVRNIRPI